MPETTLCLRLHCVCILHRVYTYIVSAAALCLQPHRACSHTAPAATLCLHLYHICIRTVSAAALCLQLYRVCSYTTSVATPGLQLHHVCTILSVIQDQLRKKGRGELHMGTTARRCGSLRGQLCRPAAPLRGLERQDGVVRKKAQV